MATLKKKTLGIISATLIGLILIIYLSSHSTVINCFGSPEEQDAIDNAVCIKNIVLSHIQNVEKKAADWSVWDESIDFIYGNCRKIGFPVLAGKPIMLTAQPVVKSEFNGPIFGTLLIGIVFGMVVNMLLGRSQIYHLKTLQNEVKEIGKKGDFTKRVSYEGNDEVSNLGYSINSMLESLERTQRIVAKRDATINAILHAVPDMMFQVKKDGTICNYKLSTDECIYESPEAELNITLEDVLPAHIAEMERDIIEEALQTNKTRIMNYSMPVKGEMRDFEVRFVVIGDDEVLAVVKDITEIKQAEEMRRKDLLLKEVHHRVKNNLQIISSLLHLQSRKFTDRETVEAFRKSQNRAKSMAIAHEKLYQSRDMEHIELKSYIETLTTYLLNTYECNPENIKIDIKIKNITQDIDTAIPLGLIINEIVSNSLKHAFKDHKGEIFVEILPDVNGLYMLTIRDNGVGFPEDLDFMNTDSLGMKLVVSLVEQIEGTIELIRGNGTEFRIRYKELSYKRRDY